MPKIFGWRIPSKLARVQWGETEYGIGILPLGGYVKMLGQDDDPRKFREEQERARAQQEGKAATGLSDGDKTKQAFTEAPQYDPRSYPAKSVPQRMIIISAGVIMNLIFGVIMGAAAYGMGAKYTPTIIGSAMPGTAGWTKDLRPGDKIVRINDGRYDEQLRFMHDLMPQIGLNNGTEDMTLLVRRDGKEIEITVRPSDPANIGAKLLGVSPAGPR
jgi:regulator of sigma E protease